MIFKVVGFYAVYVSYVVNATLLHYCVSVIMFMTLNDEEVSHILQSCNKCELIMLYNPSYWAIPCNF